MNLNLKKSLTTLAVLISVTLMVSCGKNDNSLQNSPTTKTDYVGTWVNTTSVVNPQYPQTSSVTITLVLTSSTYSQTVNTTSSVMGINISNYITLAGTLTASNNQLTLTTNQVTIPDNTKYDPNKPNDPLPTITYKKGTPEFDTYFNGANSLNGTVTYSVSGNKLTMNSVVYTKQ
jgi:hypothetical protein